MKFKFEQKKITGILTVIPKEEKSFDDEMSQYTSSTERMLRLKKVMGFDRHRVVKDGTCMSDLSVYGMELLFQKGALSKEDIGALLLVTESPDYFLPATSNVIQGRLKLSDDVYCLDINNGCCGFIVGLLQAFQLLEHMSNKKVVLIVGDVLSRKVSPKDRKSYPLSGDAAAIVILENDETRRSQIVSEMRMDGTRSDALMIPAGGFRLPASEKTAEEYEDEDGNIRCLNNITMKGGEVFNFMQIDVPPQIENVMKDANITKDEIDWFLFHQPNKFMVEKLADALEVPREKVPSNVVSLFGNAAGATIPTNICHNLGKSLLDKEFRVCFAGFGVGLAWGAIVMPLGNLDFCEFAEY